MTDQIPTSDNGETGHPISRQSHRGNCVCVCVGFFLFFFFCNEIKTYHPTHSYCWYSSTPCKHERHLHHDPQLLLNRLCFAIQKPVMAKNKGMAVASAFRGRITHQHVNIVFVRKRHCTTGIFQNNTHVISQQPTTRRIESLMTPLRSIGTAGLAMLHETATRAPHFLLNECVEV